MLENCQQFDGCLPDPEGDSWHMSFRITTRTIVEFALTETAADRLIKLFHAHEHDHV